jgi:hypothetical protein
MKKLNQLFLLMATICSLNAIAQTIPSYVPTTGLVGWWPFNGNATDESINTNNGIINGATLTTDRVGATNKAYSFNNTDITVPIANSNFLNDFSISIWVNIDSTSRYNTYPTFFSGQNASIIWQVAIWPIPSTIPQFNFYFLNNYNIPGSQVEDGHIQKITNYNTWHHLVIKNLSHINYLYLNGALVATSSPSTLQGVQSGSYIKFGNGILIPTEKFIGKLDDIGIWNRALTDCEIKKLYNSGSGLTLSTSTSTICLGESKVLSASGATNYLWSNGATTSSITVTPTVSTVYTVTTTYSVGCTDMRTITITVNPCTGINESENSQLLSIFPNPAKTQININTDVNYTSLTIVNTIGQVMIKNEKTNVLSIESLNHGVYFIQLVDKENKVIAIKKFIKE